LARYHYERLSDAAAAQLATESSRQFLHVGAILIFERGPLARPDGGVDFDAIRSAVEARLGALPAWRRKLRWIPFENHPIWVDDREFNLDYHLRHTSLARPGSPEQLCKLAARLQAQRLDRSRPLWECWVVEGLEGDRFALLTKTHVALADVEGDLLGSLLSADPGARAPAAEPFRPRPMPSAVELVRDEVVREARVLRRGLGRLARLRSPEHLAEDLRRRADRAARALGYSLRRSPDTPLDGPAGPHRRFEKLVLSLEEARGVRRALGGSIHDVLLATLAGAAARYLDANYVNPATLDFLVALPADPGAPAGRGPARCVRLELPIWERDPKRRLERVRALAVEDPAKPSLEVGDPVGAWTPFRVLQRGARALTRSGVARMRVVAVPGPQQPLHLEGARLVECFGMVPVGPQGGIGVAVMSYDGSLCVGLNADFDRVPDLARFAACFEASFDELRRAAARAGRRLVAVG
jgi:WS/DGAT/MGAT family acyltransferase